MGCGVPTASLVPRSTPRRKLAPLPQSPSLRRAGAQAEGCQRAMWGATRSNQTPGAGGAPVPTAHPLAVPRVGAKLSRCPGPHRASPAKPPQPLALPWPPSPPPKLKNDPKNDGIDPNAARPSSAAGRAAGSAAHQDAPASDPTAGTGTPGDRLPTARSSPGRNPTEPGLLLAFRPRRSRASSSASGGPDPVRGSAGACRGIPRPVLRQCTQVTEIWELSTRQSGQSPSLQREERARCAPSEPCLSCCS